MCLAVPAKIVEQNGADAVVDLNGNRVPVSTVLTPEAVLDDWVLVHAGFAIQRLSAVEAAETWDLLREVESAQARADAQAATPASAAMETR